MLKRIRAVVAILALAALALPRPAAGQGSDLAVSGASIYVNLGKNIAWSQVNRIYYFTPITSNIGVCVFVVNNNPTSAHSFTMTVYQTGDPQVQGYTNFPGRWTTDTLQGTPSPVAAHSTTSTFIQNSAAAQIAIGFSGATTQAGSPDTADLYVVQTSSGNCGSVNGGTNGVTGVQAIGNILNTNPVVVGGVDAASGSIGPLSLSCVDGTPAAPCGLNIGQAKGNPNARPGDVSYMFAGNVAIGVVPNGYSYNSGGLFEIALAGPNSGSGTQLFTAAGQQVDTGPQTFTNGSTPITMFNVVQSRAGAIQACSFTLDVTGAVSGTSPTLDVYIQDSPEGTKWQDLVHFQQQTATGGKLIASVGQPASFTPITRQNLSLAVATVSAHVIQPFIQMVAVVGGTTSSFAGVDVVASCR